MSKLLVSVRNAVEARLAADAKVDLIDVKEPALGSLGAASLAVWGDIASQIGGRMRLSAALGELCDWDAKVTDGLPGRYQYGKIGLAGCRALSDWQERWRRAIATLPGDLNHVAVIYADESAGAPDAKQVLEAARDLGCRAVLIDTFMKDGKSLLDHLSLERLEGLLCAVREQDMLAVVAGSLDATSIQQILPLEPDYVAVRGAVCRGNRASAIDSARLARIAGLVAQCT